MEQIYPIPGNIATLPLTEGHQEAQLPCSIQDSSSALGSSVNASGPLCYCLSLRCQIICLVCVFCMLFVWYWFLQCVEGHCTERGQSGNFGACWTDFRPAITPPMWGFRASMSASLTCLVSRFDGKVPLHSPIWSRFLHTMNVKWITANVFFNKHFLEKWN